MMQIYKTITMVFVIIVGMMFTYGFISAKDSKMSKVISAFVVVVQIMVFGILVNG